MAWCLVNTGATFPLRHPMRTYGDIDVKLHPPQIHVPGAEPRLIFVCHFVDLAITCDFQADFNESISLALMFFSCRQKRIKTLTVLIALRSHNIFSLLSPGVEPLRRESDHSPPSCAEVKNALGSTFTLTIYIKKCLL